MAVKRSALGKGLGALITENTTEEIKTGVIEVDINKIEPGIGQPRKNFDKEKIEALAESIKEHGIIQPLIVTKEKDLYYIVAGERRWRAAKKAGIKKVPVIERTATTKEVVELALIENIQREDLNPVEEAEAYQRLMKEFDMTQDQVAGVVGKSRPAIANTLRLLNFSDDIKGLLISGELSVGQARPLLALDDKQEQLYVAQQIVKAGLNARQVEDFIKKFISKKEISSEKEKKEKNENTEIVHVQNRLRSSLGTKVTLNDNKGKGKITIEYYSADERERLIEFLTSK